MALNRLFPYPITPVSPTPSEPAPRVYVRCGTRVAASPCVWVKRVRAARFTAGRTAEAGGASTRTASSLLKATRSTAGPMEAASAADMRAATGKLGSNRVTLSTGYTGRTSL
jgi:hypothetical protein